MWRLAPWLFWCWLGSLISFAFGQLQAALRTLLFLPISSLVSLWVSGDQLAVSWSPAVLRLGWLWETQVCSSVSSSCSLSWVCSWQMQESKKDTCLHVPVIFMPLLTLCLLMSQWPKCLTWLSPDSRVGEELGPSMLSVCHTCPHLIPSSLLHFWTLQFMEWKFWGLFLPSKLLLNGRTSSCKLSISLLNYTIQHEIRVYGKSLA